MDPDPDPGRPKNIRIRRIRIRIRNTVKKLLLGGKCVGWCHHVVGSNCSRSRQQVRHKVRSANLILCPALWWWKLHILKEGKSFFWDYPFRRRCRCLLCAASCCCHTRHFNISLYDLLFRHAGWCAMCMAGAVTSAFTFFISLRIFQHYPFATKSFKTVPLKSPFFAMQDGVHGRGGDLRLCLHKIFWDSPFKTLFCHAGWCAWQARWPEPLPSSSLQKFFETVPLKSPFLSCRMVCMAGAVTSACTILNSLKNLLKLSL